MVAIATGYYVEHGFVAAILAVDAFFVLLFLVRYLRTRKPTERSTIFITSFVFSLLLGFVTIVDYRGVYGFLSQWVLYFFLTLFFVAFFPIYFSLLFGFSKTFNKWYPRSDQDFQRYRLSFVVLFFVFVAGFCLVCIQLFYMQSTEPQLLSIYQGTWLLLTTIVVCVANTLYVVFTLQQRCVALQRKLQLN